MARKPNAPAEESRADHAETNGLEARTASVDQVVQQLRQLLEEGRLEKALEVVGRSPVRSTWLSNAAAVCQIRLGSPEKAVEILRPLVVQGGIHLRSDVPAAFKLNFAAALLATGNLDGFLATLHEVGTDEHPAAGRYREAYRRWKAGFTLWEKVKMSLGGKAARPFVLDFPPGEVI